jgi:hypothetical protein
MAAYLMASGEPPEDDESRAGPSGPGAEADLLPYRVEVWDPTGAFVEQVVAMTRNRTIGWAAYFATTEQFPSRVITFRDQYGELGRWTAKKH